MSSIQNAAFFAVKKKRKSSGGLFNKAKSKTKLLESTAETLRSVNLCLRRIKLLKFLPSLKSSLTVVLQVASGFIVRFPFDGHESSWGPLCQ